MFDKLFSSYLENPLPETGAAYDKFIAAQGGKIDDTALTDYTAAIEEAAYKAGFADALALIQEAAAIRRAG